jgi:hypothetical protein
VDKNGYSNVLSYTTDMPVRRQLNQDFFKKWSPEMAYVLGYFAADGSMIRNKRGGCYIEFTTIDKCLLESLIRATNAHQHIAVRKRKGRGKKWKTQYRIQIGSRKWFEDLGALGFTRAKSSVLRFPKAPTDFFGDFVRGYFDGDGCVYFGKQWSTWHRKQVWSFTTRFTSGTKKFLVELQKRLKSYNVQGGYIYSKNRGHELVFSRHDSVALYEIMYNTANTSNLFLPRKRVKLEKAIEVLKLRA